MSWFRKKNKVKKPGKVYSIGGSRMYKYNGNEFGKTEIGFTGEEVFVFAEERERKYDALFGESVNVLHETLPLVPHIDVYQYPPGFEGRDFWTFVTSGMSDLDMTIPEDVDSKYSKVELIFYCDKQEGAFSELLRTLSHFPHDNNTWLAPGHTMPNGNPPSPIFEDNSDLNHFLFMYTILAPDNSLCDRLVLDGNPVNFLWVVPITQAECDLKLHKGMDAIYDLFDSLEHPHVFYGDRKSYL